jgi:hypothetical protein
MTSRPAFLQGQPYRAEHHVVHATIAAISLPGGAPAVRLPEAGYEVSHRATGV